ncbi:hypothetical protein ACFL7D_09600, partial [candidate division KSB1 bacterium]
PSRKTNPLPSFTIVSRGMGIDSKERIWILTPNKSFPSIKLDEGTIETDKSDFDLQILNSEGIFLGTLPVPEYWFEFKMRIFGDRLFLIESKDEMCVHEYKIIDK